MELALMISAMVFFTVWTDWSDGSPVLELTPDMEV
jgi:hypothetical protein